MNSKYKGEDLRPAPPFFVMGDEGWELVICPQCGATAENHIMSIELDYPMRCPPAPKQCKCGLHEIPEWVDGVNWYWGHHTQDKCTVELPNERCWCGRLRTEHQNKEGHDPDVVYENRYGKPKTNSQAFPDEPGYENGYSPPIEEMEKVMRERLYGKDKEENPIANLSDWQPFEDQFTGEILYKQQSNNKLSELVNEVREALRQPPTPMKVDGHHVRVGREKPLRRLIEAAKCESCGTKFSETTLIKRDGRWRCFDERTCQAQTETRLKCENCRGSGIVADPCTEYATMSCMRCNGRGYHVDLSRETSIYAPAAETTAPNMIAEFEKLQTSHNALQALVEYIRADVCSTDKNCWCCHDMLSVANAQANNAKLLPGVDCYRCSGPPGHPDCRFCKGSGRLPGVGMDNPVPKAEE